MIGGRGIRLVVRWGLVDDWLRRCLLPLKQPGAFQTDRHFVTARPMEALYSMTQLAYFSCPRRIIQEPCTMSREDSQEFTHTVSLTGCAYPVYLQAGEMDDPGQSADDWRQAGWLDDRRQRGYGWCRTGDG
nr:hypothetical protein Iba_chr02cCG17030 [Ipomoea batatas]